MRPGGGAPKLNFARAPMDGIACLINMSKMIVKIADFNVSNLSVGPMKSLDSGGKMASLFYKYGDSSSTSLTTQVGSLSLPYGMNTFDKAGPVKYSIDLSLRGHDENEKVKTIYDAFSALDNWMIDQGVLNSKAWFKSQLTRDVIKAFYTPMVKVAKDAEGNPKPYPPTFKVNLKKQNDQFDVKVYDDQARPYEGVPLEDLLVKGAQVTVLIQCTSVWFAGSKFGLSWKAKQVRMDKVPESMRGYAFLDDDDAAPVRSQTSAARAPVAQNKFATLQDDGEDEDEAEDDNAFVAPTPQKQSVLTAMMPKASQPVAEDEEDAEDHEPIPAPTATKKLTTTAVKKQVVKGVKKA